MNRKNIGLECHSFLNSTCLKTTGVLPKECLMYHKKTQRNYNKRFEWMKICYEIEWKEEGWSEAEMDAPCVMLGAMPRATMAKPRCRRHHLIGLSFPSLPLHLSETSSPTYSSGHQCPPIFWPPSRLLHLHGRL